MYNHIPLHKLTPLCTACIHYNPHEHNNYAILFTIIVMSDSCALLLVAGISVAVSVPTTSIITAIVLSIIIYCCCAKRKVPASQGPLATSTTPETSCAAEVNPAYSHFDDHSHAQ